MSWLSGGLSQFSSLTDQISSFTKDVLTETTEEIEDPTAELQVARRKIEQLEDVNSHYKTEWEKVQKHSEEVRERAETAECQIAAISQEYRKLLQEKDNELRRLKSETASLKEQQRKLVISGESSQSPLKDLASARFFPESSDGGEGGYEMVRREEGGGGEGVWEAAVLEPVAAVEGGGWENGEEYHDFGDVISSQGEINRLQLELSKVKVECQHWRTLAKEKGHSGSEGPVEAELAALREQVEDLQLCLQRERGQHQHEVAALVAAQHETLRSLDQQPRAAELDRDGHLRQSRAQDVEGRAGSVVNNTLRGSLLSALEEVSLDERDSERDKEREESGEEAVSLLRAELEGSRERCGELERELNRLRSELKQQLEGRREKKASEREGIERLQLELQSLKTEKTRLEQEMVNERQTMAAERGRLGEEVERAGELNARLQTQEQVLSQLRAELRDSQSSGEALKVQVQQFETETSHLGNINTQLSSSVEGEKERVQQLHAEVDRLKQRFALEQQAYTQHAEQERENLTATVTELQASVSEHERCIARLRTQCEHSQNDAETLTVQISELSTEVQSRDRQLERLRGQEAEGGEGRSLVGTEVEILRLKREAERVTELESKMAELETENRQLSAEATQFVGGDGGLQLEEAGSAAQLSESRAKLKVGEEESRCERLQAHLARLTEEHDRELAQLLSEREGLEREVGRLERELEESRAVGGGVTSGEIETGSGEQSEMAERSRLGAAVQDSFQQVPGVGQQQLLETVGTLEALKRTNSEKDALISRLTSSLATADSVKSELQTVLHGRLGEMETREREAVEAFSRVELEMGTLREVSQTEEERKTELQYLAQDRESRIAQLEAEVVEVNKRLSQVQAELTAAEEGIREKGIVIEQKDINLCEVGKLLRAREEEVAAVRRDCVEKRESESRVDESQLRETLQQPEESVREGSAMLEQVTREREELVVALRAKENEVEGIRAQLAEARKTLDSQSRETEILTSRNSKLSQALESAERETVAVRAERDGLAGRVAVSEEATRTSEEKLAAKQAECVKLTKQLEQLKTHLMQIEEQYTQDALRAEERERVGRRRAEQLQETLRNTSNAGQQDNLQTRARVSALEEQLHALAEQRDGTVLELSVAREETESHAAALRNLQSVLEQFQRDQSSELSVALKRSQNELATALSECQALRAQHFTVQKQLTEAQVEARSVSQQFAEREKTVEELQRTVTGVEVTLHSTENAMGKLLREEGGRVEKSLVKNLVMGYVQAPDRKRAEVLNLIAKILDFSSSELEQAQGRRGGWLSGLWGRAIAPTTPPPISPIESGSLSRLFVSFLESESAPPSSHHSAPPLSHSHLSPPPTGRVGPATDLDRPSRATAANLAYPSLSLRSTSLPPSSHSVPSTLPPSSHSVLSTLPPSSHSVPSTLPPSSHSVPSTLPPSSHSVPSTLPPSSHSVPSTLPPSSHSVPSTLPPSSHSVPSTLPPSSHASTVPISSSISASKDTSGSTPIHSHIDTLSLPDTETTRHSYTNTSTTPHSYTGTAMPQSTHSGLDTRAVGTLAALTLPAGSFPSPVPPNTPDTSRATAASTSSTGGPRTALTSPPLLHAVPDTRGFTPAWSKNHSYQSSILKNLLSTDQ